MPTLSLRGLAMRLNQMYRNVLGLSLEELIVKVEEDSVKRAAFLAEVVSKIDMPRTTKSSSTKLSEQEKAILKALGLSMKDVKNLAGAQLEV